MPGPRTRRPAVTQEPLQPEVDLKNPILQMLQQKSVSSTEDLQQDISAQTGATPEQVAAAIQTLHEGGYIYPPEDGYWSPTYHGMRGGVKTPAASYEKVSGLTNEAFFEKEFPKYYNHFKQMHPEYQSIFERVERSRPNLVGMAEDVFKILNGKYTIFSKKLPNVSPFEAPDTMSSVEQAIAELLGEMGKYHTEFKGKIPSVGTNYETQKKAYQYFSTDGAGLLSSVSRAFPEGFVITKSVLIEKLQSLVRKRLTAAEKDAFFNYLYGYVVNQIDTLPNPIFLGTTDTDLVIKKLRDAFKASSILPSQVMHNFMSSSAAVISDQGGVKLTVRTDAKDVISGVVSDNDFTGVDLTKFDFSDTSIKGSNFQGVNCTESIWNASIVDGNNFTGANFTGAVFNPKTFVNNKIEGADMEGAAIVGKGIDFRKNEGKPKNYVMRNIAVAKSTHEDVLALPAYNTSESFLPADNAQQSDARVVAKILRYFLDKGGVLSDLSFVRVFRQAYAKLESALVEQMKHWLADKTAVPPFIAQFQSQGTNLKGWWGSLAKDPSTLDDFTKDEITQVFRLIGDLQSGGERKPVQQNKPKGSEEDERVSAFLSGHSPNAPLSKDELLKVLTVGDGVLANEIKPLPDRLNNRTMYYLYHRLVTSLNDFSHNQAVDPVKAYQSFAIKAKPQAVFGGNYGTGEQFAVPCFLDRGAIPQDIRGPLEKVERMGSHIDGAFSWARVYPAIFSTATGEGGETSKSIWQVTEMQSDTNSHMTDCHDISKEDAKKLRAYFTKWPEVNLDAVIEYAAMSNVDEVWVPQGEAVVFKTWHNGHGAIASSLKRADGSFVDWSDRYDRAAKMFNGKLQNVGVSAPLDPGSNYMNADNPGRASVFFFVIPIKGVKKSASWDNLMSLKLADLDEQDLDKLGQELRVWLPQFIAHYRHQQPELSSYIKDSWLADGGMDKFLEQPSANIAALTPTDIGWIKNFVEHTLGYEISGPPFVDWMRTMIFVTLFIHDFVRRQKESTPGIASDEELARDAIKFAQEALPAPVKESPRYHEFMESLGKYCQDHGYGDVLSDSLSLRAPSIEDLTHPPESPGAEMAGAHGEHLPPEEEEPGVGEGTQGLKLQPDKTKEPGLGLGLEAPSQREMVDTLLDQLSVAKRVGDTQAIERLKRELQQLTVSKMTLKFDDFALRLG